VISKRRHLPLFINSNDFFNNHSHAVLKKWTQTVQTRGAKRKLDLIFGNVFKLFFGFLRSNDIIFTDLRQQLEVQKHNFGANSNLFFLNIFFKNLFLLLRPMFVLGLDKIKTKGKKKDPKAEIYTSKVLYIFPENRDNIVLKWVYMYSNYFLDKTALIRIFKAIFYTLLEQRDSFLFLKKMEIYLLYIKTQKKV